MSKELGSVVISAPEDVHANGSDVKKYSLSGDDADKTLADARFVIGDYVDCAIFPPLPDGSVISRSSVGMKGGDTRENGYGRIRGGGYGLGRGGRGGRETAQLLSQEWRRGEQPPSHRAGFGGGRGRPY